MCPVRQSKSIVQADARKQALCSQRTSYAHRPRRRLSVRSGLAVLGYEADCQKLTSEGGSPVLPTNHSLEQQRQHGKIPLDVRCLMKKIRPSSHPLSPYFQHFTPKAGKVLHAGLITHIPHKYCTSFQSAESAEWLHCGSVKKRFALR